MWPVRTLCPSPDWRTAGGLTRAGFRWVVGGAAIAQRPATSIHFLRRMFWSHSAIWATPRIATGLPPTAPGMQFASQSLLPKKRGVRRKTPARLSRHGFFASLMYASATICRRTRVNWSLICSSPHGFAHIKTPASEKWRSASWSPT